CCLLLLLFPFVFFFLITSSSTVIYTLSLHDALPILFSCFGPSTFIELRAALHKAGWKTQTMAFVDMHDFGDMLMESGFKDPVMEDRKSTRLNSSHVSISYAVFCLKIHKQIRQTLQRT